MRRTDIFKKFFACIIESNVLYKELTIRILQCMGIVDYVYYSDFKEALNDLNKFYSVRLPDFILSEWYDDFFNPTIMEIYKHSSLKSVPLLILTHKDQPDVHDQAKKIGIMHFITKPIQFKTLQNAIIQVLKGKFNIRTSTKSQ